jgi:hypothetical protein
MIYAGACGVLLLLLFLIVSAQLMERGLSSLVLRARQRVLERLPLDLPAGERARTLRNLDVLVRTSRPPAERGSLMNGFLSRVSAALADNHLSAAEIEDLNLFLEGRAAVDGAASPPPTALSRLR